jgi:hypothetical protein
MHHVKKVAQLTTNHQARGSYPASSRLGFKRADK